MDKKRDPILFYEAKYYMFSNFASFAVVYKGLTWMTSEHAYQAAKFEDKGVIKLIHSSLSAHDSKKIAHVHKDKMNPDWSNLKVSIMEEIVREKIKMHPYIQEKLIETGERDIIENSPEDSFWGSGSDGNGRNELGKIWMKLRDELKETSEMVAK